MKNIIYNNSETYDWNMAYQVIENKELQEMLDYLELGSKRYLENL